MRELLGSAYYPSCCGHWLLRNENGGHIVVFCLCGFYFCCED